MAKKKRNKDMSIITEVKEPFSLDRFLEKNVLGTWNSFKEKLDERGILFFFLSPFQYRNRLIAKLFLIVVCILGGVVPRMFTLLHEARERYAASEISGISNSIFGHGPMAIVPLQSSYYERQHVIVFNIQGATSDGVPSTEDEFDIRFFSLRSVSDLENVRYRYRIIPVDAINRLLVLYVDNRKQNDAQGVFGLSVSIKGLQRMKTPIELYLSDSQETNGLFSENGLDLNVVSSRMTRLGNKSDVIKKAEEAVDAALSIYKVNERRLESSDIKISPTYDNLIKWVEKNKFLPNIKDDSTTSDVDKKVDILPVVSKLEPSIVLKGANYGANEFKDDKDYANSVGAIEYPTVVERFTKVKSAVETLNQLRFSRYTELQKISRVFKKEVSFDSFTEPKVPEIGN